CRGNTPNLSAGAGAVSHFWPYDRFGKPQIAIGSCCNAAGGIRRWQGEHFYAPYSSDAFYSGNLRGKPISEPEIAISPGRDRGRISRRGRKRKLFDPAGGSNRANFTALRETAVSEPEIAIRPDSDATQVAMKRIWREFADLT